MKCIWGKWAEEQIQVSHYDGKALRIALVMLWAAKEQGPLGAEVVRLLRLLEINMTEIAKNPQAYEHRLIKSCMKRDIRKSNPELLDQARLLVGEAKAIASLLVRCNMSRQEAESEYKEAYSKSKEIFTLQHLSTMLENDLNNFQLD